MDAAALLRQARLDARLSQRGLARTAGTSRSTITAYESGAISPTVRQLDRLVGACGLQVRASLEPKGADVDQLVDAALAAGADGLAEDAVADLLRFAESLDAGGVTWAVDGATAVAVQGLAVEHRERGIAVLDDAATRAWLRRIWAKGTNRDGFSLAPSWDESPELVRIYVRREVYTRLGFVRLRFVDAPPKTLSVTVGGRPLPVLPLLLVEQEHPALADLLRRYRERCA